MLVRNTRDPDSPYPHYPASTLSFHLPFYLKHRAPASYKSNSPYSKTPLPLYIPLPIAIAIAALGLSQSKMPLLFILLSLLFLSTHTQYATAAEAAVKASCAHVHYRRLCVKARYRRAPKANTPIDLAKASLWEAQDQAQKAAAYITLVVRKAQRPLNFTEKQVVDECREFMSEEIDLNIRKVLTELNHMQPENFSMVMEDCNIYTSSAMTSAATCIDEVDSFLSLIEKAAIIRRVRQVLRILGNALDLLTQAGGAHDGHP